MQQDVKVPVHPVRAEQLMILAERWKCSSAEAMARLIRDRISSGDLPDTTPGLEVAAFGNLVAFKIDFDRAPPMSWEQALKISQALEQLANGRSKGFKCAYSADTTLVFNQTGDSYAVSFTTPGESRSKTVTPDIVEDLARQFRMAAMTAKANKTGRTGLSGLPYARANGSDEMHALSAAL